MLPKDFEKHEELVSQYTMSYLKKDKDKVKIRILSDFIQGKSVWGKKDDRPFPFRFRIGHNVPVSCIGVNKEGEPNRVQTFIAAVVYNYTTKQVEVFETTKRTIIDAIYDMEQDEDWGDSKGYDMTIARSGEGFSDTKYSLLPSNKAPFALRVAWKSVNLEALYDGGNPFEGTAVVSDGLSQEISDDIPF
jgi:hypothetical protein